METTEAQRRGEESHRGTKAQRFGGNCGDKERGDSAALRHGVGGYRGHGRHGEESHRGTKAQRFGGNCGVKGRGDSVTLRNVDQCPERTRSLWGFYFTGV